MATAAQINANLENAKKSTGPRTLKGKIASSFNPLRHGFRSQTVLLPGDDPAEYEELLTALTDHFGTDDLTQQRAVREMADAEWRLRRCRRYQEELVSARIQELAAEYPDQSPFALQVLAHESLTLESTFFSQLQRWESKFERQYDKAYRQWASYQDAGRRSEQHRIEMLLQAPPPRSVAFPPIRTIPEPASPNLPNEPNLTPRNASCPCGSGIKFKRCCGQNAPPVLNLRN